MKCSRLSLLLLQAITATLYEIFFADEYFLLSMNIFISSLFDWIVTQIDICEFWVCVTVNAEQIIVFYNIFALYVCASSYIFNQAETVCDTIS